MKTTNRINRIRVTLAAGLLLAATGAAAGECIDFDRPNYAEMAGPSIRMQAVEAMANMRNELRLTSEDARPVQLERPATTVAATGDTPARADKSGQTDRASVTGGLVIYIGNR